MATLDERVASLEAMTPDLRNEMLRGFAQIDARFGLVDAQFAQVNARFNQIDRQFAQIDARFAQVDARFERLEGRFDRLEDKVDRHFVWIVGIQLTTMTAFVGVLAAAYFR